MKSYELKEIPFWAQALVTKALLGEKVEDSYVKNGQRLRIIKYASGSIDQIFFNNVPVVFDQIR